MSVLRRIIYPFGLIFVLLILLIEVPSREIRRAWRNLCIARQYRDELGIWASYWRNWP